MPCTAEQMKMLELEVDAGNATLIMSAVDEAGYKTSVLDVENLQDYRPDYYPKNDLGDNGYRSSYYCSQCEGSFDFWSDAEAHFDQPRERRSIKWW